MVEKNVVLSGLSGSGKTTVGRMLAKKLNRPFLDLDILIEETERMTIPEIFQKFGEEKFREIESKLTIKVAELKNSVIALGGGTLMRPQNRESLKKCGTVVFLNPPLDTLLKRLQGDDTRPLLKAEDIKEKKEKLIRLYYERINTYLGGADLVVDGDENPEKIAEKIISKLSLPKEKRTSSIKKEIAVKSESKIYRVVVGFKILQEALADYLKENRFSGIVLVTSPVINQLFGSPLREVFIEKGFDIKTVFIEDEEEKKDINTLSKIYDEFIKLGVDRSSLVIALGGGITGDVAGFAAATYMRGIKWVYVPTTLLAQVDASVGGKVAVNHREGKNLIGAFYQPDLVITDINHLFTLPDKIFGDGMAEVIKTAILQGELFKYIEENAIKIKERDPETLFNIVYECIKFKKEIVEKDERDEGKRMILNLGHTFGHALEAASGYKVSHGQAVSAGTVMAFKLSILLGNNLQKDLERVKELFTFFNLPVSIKELPVQINEEEILNFLLRDKKAVAGRPRFIVPYNIGDVRVVEKLSGDLKILLKNVIDEKEGKRDENPGDSRT
ncbi:3-dehydroquinate synthase [Thermovenabulum sp.]|uniref:3-dehydroquinate synthase n=1 Tax=Thermovenabulum sp. TaxID=3100335 RepID=UPI003C7C4EA3